MKYTMSDCKLLLYYKWIVIITISSLHNGCYQTRHGPLWYQSGGMVVPQSAGDRQNYVKWPGIV